MAKSRTCGPQPIDKMTIKRIKKKKLLNVSIIWIGNNRCDKFETKLLFFSCKNSRYIHEKSINNNLSYSIDKNKLKIK